MPAIPRSGSAPHQLSAAEKTTAQKKRANAAGLKMFDQRVRSRRLDDSEDGGDKGHPQRLAWAEDHRNYQASEYGATGKLRPAVPQHVDGHVRGRRRRNGDRHEGEHSIRPFRGRGKGEKRPQQE